MTQNWKEAVRLAKMAKVTAVMGKVLTQEAGTETSTLLEWGDRARIDSPTLGLSLTTFSGELGISLSCNEERTSIALYTDGSVEILGSSQASEHLEHLIMVLGKTIQELS